MKSAINSTILMLSTLMLAGCLSGSSEPPPEEDLPLSRSQQERALLRSRPPQEFGFSVYPVENGIAFAGRGRLHPQHFTTTDMIEEGVPVISMRGRYKRNTLNALIDTSSPESWMEFVVSQEFNAYFMNANNQTIPYLGSYNTGGIKAFAGIITQLRIDTLFIEYIPFYIRMSRGSLGPLNRGIQEPHVDAVIGYDNLKAFEYIQFNLRNNTISFSATTPYSPKTEHPVDAALIVKIPGHGLAVEGVIDGQPTPVLLDLAGDFSLARGDVKVATTRKIQVGDLVMEDVPTLLLPVHDIPPRIGRKLLSPYVVTICNKRGMVYFEKLPEDPKKE